MTLMVSAVTAWIIAAGATAAGGALVFVEWRRPDQRHRVARVAASLLAVGALAVLGVRPVRPAPAFERRPAVEAALWTAPGGAGDNVAALARVATDRRFTLPGVGNVPPGVKVAPDAAFLRRQFPEIGTLHVLGGGLEPWDLAALRGVRLIFHPSFTGTPPAAVSFLRAPREGALGGRFSVQGRVSLLPTDGTAKLTLSGPDGAEESHVTLRAEADHTAAFALEGAPTRAAGQFTWRLRLQVAGRGDREEELGVAVAPPVVPRVLILESSPRFDTAPLRRWLGEAGGAATTRTAVGQDRSRFTSVNGAPGEFTALDGALLARFDVVLVDARALAALAMAEGAALRTAVTDNGLGVLVLGDGASALTAAGEKERGPEAVFFLPWELEKVGEAGVEDTTRPVRPSWAGQPKAPAGNVPAEPFAIRAPEGTAAVTLPGARTLVRDGQGRALAAGARRGRGQVALTLVRETQRWRQGGEPEAFAAYWSFLLAEVARRTGEIAGGRWSLAGGAENGPAFVQQPLELRWTGAGTPAPGVVEAADGAGETVRLPLARDPVEPTRWRGTFWPRRPGWHRVRTAKAGAPGLSFYVHAADAWPRLRAERRRMATMQAAALGPADGDGGDNRGQPPPDEPLPPGWMFVIFSAAAIYLWTERRVSSPARI